MPMARATLADGSLSTYMRGVDPRQAFEPGAQQGLGGLPGQAPTPGIWVQMPGVGASVSWGGGVDPAVVISTVPATTPVARSSTAQKPTGLPGSSLAA